MPVNSFSRIALIFVVLSLVAAVVGGMLSMQGNEAASYGDWYAVRDWHAAAMYTFSSALIGFLIGVFLLYLNTREKKKRAWGQAPPPQQ